MADLATDTATTSTVVPGYVLPDENAASVAAEVAKYDGARSLAAAAKALRSNDKIPREGREFLHQVARYVNMPEIQEMVNGQFPGDSDEAATHRRQVLHMYAAHIAALAIHAAIARGEEIR